MQAEIELKARSTTHDSAMALLKGIMIEVKSENGKVQLKALFPQSIPESNTSANFKIKVPKGWVGELYAETINGNLAACDFVASLDLLTTNGNVAIRDWDGNVRVTTTNGNINGKNLGGGDYYELVTTNGNIAVKMTRRPEARMNLANTNGNVVLEIPKESGVNLDLCVDNGDINVSGFVDDNKLSSKDNIISPINGGGPTIHVTTNNGNIGVSGY